MLELIYPHAPGVFGDLRQALKAEHPALFEGVDQP
jgi:hypothetical protein